MRSRADGDFSFFGHAMLFTLQQLFEGYASDTFWHAFLRTPTAGYPNGELVFHGIENIHVMRDSLAALLKVIKGADSMHSFLAELDSCRGRGQ